jgi:hypothetical protein
MVVIEEVVDASADTEVRKTTLCFNKCVLKGIED